MESLSEKSDFPFSSFHHQESRSGIEQVLELEKIKGNLSLHRLSVVKPVSLACKKYGRGSLRTDLKEETRSKSQAH